MKTTGAEFVANLLTKTDNMVLLAERLSDGVPSIQDKVYARPAGMSMTCQVLLTSLRKEGFSRLMRTS